MLEKQLNNLMKNYGVIFINDLISKLNEQNLNASGKAARSLDYSIDGDTLKITGVSYIDQMNKGRRSGTFVPIRPLQDWIERKFGLSVNEARPFAFALSKSIQRKGTIKRFGYGGGQFIDYIIKKNILGINNKLTDLINKYAVDEIKKAAKQ